MRAGEYRPTVQRRGASMIDPMTLQRPEAVPGGGTATATDYFFALDADGRIAWPFRFIRQRGGAVVAQRWRFGHWVDSREAARFLSGEDDLCFASEPAAVEAWIARDGRTRGLRLAPPPVAVAAE